MKKKVFSFLLAFVFVLTSVSQIAFARDNDASIYYGIGIFATAEDALDALNADALSTNQNLNMRDNQKNILSAAKTEFYAKQYSDVSASWDTYFNKITGIYTPEYRQKVDRYFKMRYIQSVNGVQAVSDALTALDTSAQYNTAGKSLLESNAAFDSYITQLNGIYAANSSAISSFMTGKDAQLLAFEKEALFNSTKAILGLIYSTTGEGSDSNAFDYSFTNDFNNNDLVKKNLALFFGKEFTTELANNSLKTNVKNYIVSNGQAATTINSMLPNVFVYNKEQSVDAAYDILGTVIKEAYNANPVQAAVVNFFGDGTAKGAFEIVTDIFDTSSEVQNVWFNMLLREFVQMRGAGAVFNTITASNPTPSAVLVYDDMSASFTLSGLNEYGISSSNIPLRSNYFNVKVECNLPNYNNEVTYNPTNGKFDVTITTNLPSTYDAVATLYRSNSTTFGNVDTYIESYAITIKNNDQTGGDVPGGGGASSSKFDVKIVDSEFGKVEGPTSASSDKENKFVVVPVEGYIVDKVLVNGTEVPITREGTRATLVIDNVTKNIRIEPVYMQFIDRKNHVAYIIGDEKGNFNPDKYLTRGETATIFHRLLTDLAKARFAIDENIYDDVRDELWSADYILSLANAGILTGYPDNTYRPEGSVTRAEFATIVCKIFGVAEGSESALSDVDGHWAERYITGVEAKGWITGYPDGTFKPDRVITRAEAVTIVNRMLGCELMEHAVSGDIGYLDCDVTDWFFIDVIKASTDHLN